MAHGTTDDGAAVRRHGGGASFVTATTGLVTWSVGRVAFRGQPPLEVAVWLQLAVPLAMGWLQVEVAYRMARRRAER